MPGCPERIPGFGRKHSYRLYRCTVRMTLARCCLALFVHEPPRPPRTLAAARRIRSWLAAQSCRAILVRHAACRRSVWPLDMARRTHSPLDRRVGSSPPSDNACPRHAPCSAAFLHWLQPWCSPNAGTVCPRHAPRKSPCRLELTWCSPPPGIACPRRAPRSGECHH